MKEASGELNMTVITVVAIAAVGAFFYAFVWPAVKGAVMQNTKCQTAYDCTGTGQSRKCMYQPIDNGGKPDGNPYSINCPERSD